MVARRPGPPLDPNMTAMMAMQQTGGTPPGAPPPNAFDMDPMQLEQMIGQGWKVNDDGSMVPPGPGTGMGGPGGYDLDGDGMGQAVAGPQGIGGPPLGEATGPNQGLGAQDVPSNLPGPALPSASPTPTPDASMGGMGMGGTAVGGVGGMDMGGLGSSIAGRVRSAATPAGLASPAPASPGAPGPDLSIGGTAAPASNLPGPALTPLDEPAPKLDPVAFTRAQNERSLQPAVDAQDPNGYAGADVTRSDPRNLIPRRRRTSPANGPLTRLRESVGLDSAPIRAKRP